MSDLVVRFWIRRPDSIWGAYLPSLAQRLPSLRVNFIKQFCHLHWALNVFSVPISILHWPKFPQKNLSAFSSKKSLKGFAHGANQTNQGFNDLKQAYTQTKMKKISKECSLCQFGLGVNTFCPSRLKSEVGWGHSTLSEFEPQLFSFLMTYF